METLEIKRYQKDLYRPVQSNYLEEKSKRAVFQGPSNYISFIGGVRSRPFIKVQKPHYKNIHVQINDDSIKLPKELESIVNQIEEAKEILDYNFNWDEQAAMPTNVKTFEQAAAFIKNYALYLYQTYSVILTTPYIDILKDGSVSVHWENLKSQFLIVFKEENVDLAYYYAELKDKKVPFKSAVEIGGPIDKFLAI